VVHVSDDRRTGSLEGFYAGLTDAQKVGLESISMDMWPAYITATLAAIPGAEQKIAFDKFHVAKHLGEAVDKVRRREHRELLKVGIEILKGTKHDWLTNPKNMGRSRKRSFSELVRSTLKTARAWAIKELAMSLWGYVSRTWAEKGWSRWYSWAIINAIVLKADNGHAESMNSKIQMLKIRARGFRNKERFKTAIYFHLGGLDLYPEGVR